MNTGPLRFHRTASAAFRDRESAVCVYLDNSLRARARRCLVRFARDLVAFLKQHFPWE